VFLGELSQAQGQDLDVVGVDFGLLACLSQVGSVLCQRSGTTGRSSASAAAVPFRLARRV
jgi:hypothetical protein